MVSITLSVPEEMKHEMDTFQDINWSAVARQAIKKKVMLGYNIYCLFSHQQISRKLL